jgi:hypothetical protein
MWSFVQHRIKCSLLHIVLSMFTAFEDCQRTVLSLPIISFLIIRQCAVNKTERSLSNK